MVDGERGPREAHYFKPSLHQHPTRQALTDLMQPVTSGNLAEIEAMYEREAAQF